MNPLRILFMAVVGLTAVPSYAVPVLLTFQGDPFTEWEYAQRDAAQTTSTFVVDADGDGIASLVADVVPSDTAGGIHISHGKKECLVMSLPVFTPPALDDSTFPFVETVEGDSLIVELSGPSSSTFSLGQTLSVINGTITRLDGLVHENPGITSAVDVLTFDVSSLPRFSGNVVVGALLTVQVIPEPASWLLLLGIAGRHRTSRRT